MQYVDGSCHNECNLGVVYLSRINTTRYHCFVLHIRLQHPHIKFSLSKARSLWFLWFPSHGSQKEVILDIVSVELATLKSCRFSGFPLQGNDEQILSDKCASRPCRWCSIGLTPGHPWAAFSTSIELIHSPPLLMTSLDLSTSCIWPNASIVAISPVSIHPTLSTPFSICCT